MSACLPDLTGPLVLFLDDLQWADSASLHLLRLLLTAVGNSYLFVVCAYRDNEVTEAHPVQLILNDIRKEGGTVNHIILGPLDFPHLQQFIADTLTCPLEEVAPLTELVLAKTAGNPFFITEFLKSLSTTGLLTFDTQKREWQWDVAHIHARNITDNVVELMVGKVQKLGAKTQEVLKLAACLGNEFDLRTLPLSMRSRSRRPSQTCGPPSRTGSFFLLVMRTHWQALTCRDFLMKSRWNTSLPMTVFSKRCIPSFPQRISKQFTGRWGNCSCVGPPKTSRKQRFFSLQTT